MILMTQFNPFAGAILSSAQAQRQQSTEQVGQVRRRQELRKNAAHQPGDTFEHQVESSDTLGAVQDEDRRNPQRKLRLNHSRDDATEEDSDDGGDQPHLDVTA